MTIGKTAPRNLKGPKNRHHGLTAFYPVVRHRPRSAATTDSHCSTPATRPTSEQTSPTPGTAHERSKTPAPQTVWRTASPIAGQLGNRHQLAFLVEVHASTVLDDVQCDDEQHVDHGSFRFHGDAYRTGGRYISALSETVATLFEPRAYLRDSPGFSTLVDDCRVLACCTTYSASKIACFIRLSALDDL